MIGNRRFKRRETPAPVRIPGSGVFLCRRFAIFPEEVYDAGEESKGNRYGTERTKGNGMIGKKRIEAFLTFLVLLLVVLLPENALGAAKQKKPKTILKTWLCAGETAPVRESPKESAEVLWALEPETLVHTEQHVDQYYLLTGEDGRTGYISKGAVRILNAADLTAGKMFKLPHVNPKTPRLPVEKVLEQGVAVGEASSIFLAEEGRRESIPAGERVYVFAAYGSYAAVWHRGRLGYILRDQIQIQTEEDRLEQIRAAASGGTGRVGGNAALTQAFSMLEPGNAIALRYEALTGERVEPLFYAGVPYFWGGKEEKILTERWPEYTTRKQWQGTHDFYQKDSIYVYGLDCVGFVKTLYDRAGTPLEESLDDLGQKKHCQAGDHLYCSAANPFPEDWREAAVAMRPGDLLALHHPGRHVMMYIGTLRDYGYTEEDLPALQDYLDHPLMIHSGENPLAYQRFDCLTARSEDRKVSKALGSDGGVSLCILGVPRAEAETEVTAHERGYGCFDVEGACVTIFRFDNVSDYYVYRP